jgi:hypothetical protein
VFYPLVVTQKIIETSFLAVSSLDLKGPSAFEKQM